jgi:hypothetical protein
MRFTGNLFQKDIRSWLFPPDPSINQNIACRDHLDGTASWFIQSRMFKEWKTTGSFLWIHGKRTHFFHSFCIVCPNYCLSRGVTAGAGKSILWYVMHENSHPAYSNYQPAPTLLKKLKVYPVWDWH